MNVKKIFLQYKSHQSIRVNKKLTSLPGYSLLEMVVTLLLTGIVMLGLIYIFTSILNISAMANARTKAREDVDNFVQEFEKDLKNSTRVGQCGQDSGVFKCVVYTDNIYVWQTCTDRISVLETTYPYVKSNPNYINWDKDYTKFANSLCKFSADSNGNAVGETPLLRLDPIYNLEFVGITSLEDNLDTGAGTSATGTKKLITFTIVVSHPNRKMNVLNVIRQSVVTTKNYEIVVQK